MKSLVVLWRVMHEDLCIRCCIDCTDLDGNTVEVRENREGLSFLTITLPHFHRDFVRSLDQGRVTPDLFAGFRRKGELPIFLGGFLDLVFNRGDGLLLDEPDIDAIFAIRQLTLVYSKILLPTSDRRLRDAMEGYIKVDEEVATSELNLKWAKIAQFQKVGMLLWADIFSAVDLRVYKHDLCPKHGPGSTADGLRGNTKYSQREWTQRLEDIFPSGEYIIPNWREGETSLDHVTYLRPEEERPVKVTPVPKTLKTPRIIAIEPTCMQYMQQALSQAILEEMSRDPVIKQLVGFDDQVPNQDLARSGSLIGDNATLDLSEASDRVSNKHVSLLLACFPHLAEGVQASRSMTASVPVENERIIIRLNKFASMGSALTFPFEAMIFLTIIAMSVEEVLGRPLHRRDLNGLVDKVRVYGDDLIVPVPMVRCVIDNLEHFGYRVNKDKSFWTGKFRESCGKDYYAGVDVSVVKCRRVFPSSRKDASELISLVSLRNQFYFAGLWRVAEHLDGIIEGIIPFPHVGPESAVLGRWSYVVPAEAQRWCRFHHVPLVRGAVVRSRSPISKIDGQDALLKFFLKKGDEPFYNKDHLERSGRPDAVDIKIGWAPSS